MWKIFKAFRRLWLFAACDHWNKTTNLQFDDTTELVFCRGCGRVLSCTNSGERRHNPHLLLPRLDYTARERERILTAESSAPE